MSNGNSSQRVGLRLEPKWLRFSLISLSHLSHLSLISLISLSSLSLSHLSLSSLSHLSLSLISHSHRSSLTPSQSVTRGSSQHDPHSFVISTVVSEVVLLTETSYPIDVTIDAKTHTLTDRAHAILWFEMKVAVTLTRFYRNEHKQKHVYIFVFVICFFFFFFNFLD